MPHSRYTCAPLSPRLPARPSSAPSVDRSVDIWTTGGTDALVVGDVVLVDEFCPVPLVVNGQKAVTASGRTAVRSKEYGKRTVKDRTRRRTLATVIDTTVRPNGRSEPSRALKLEVVWSEAEIAEAALPVGRTWLLWQRSVNSKDGIKRVERLRGSGPRERTDEAGRAMLLQRLKAALGADPVERMRLFADPLGGDAGTPVTLGRTAAEMLLSGSEVVRIWMIRQALGLAPIPAGAQDTDARHEREADEYAHLYADDDYDEDE